ncbi:MAG: hypothetical protein OXC14_16065, partial [Rhodospirillaceae bacterium]|nr:hypothetical protein [Rhodospirillaceae bacterium]
MMDLPRQSCLAQPSSDDEPLADAEIDGNTLSGSELHNLLRDVIEPLIPTGIAQAKMENVATRG